jgi:hypothetical protein
LSTEILAFNKARDVIGKLARHEMPSETQLGSNAPRTILTIMRDVVQWSAIAHHWPNSDDPIYREKSIRLLKDAVSPPEVNSIPTPGRDIQFELFANACWNAAGTLTRLASPPAPDLLITTHPWFFGAEAKRIRGMNQVKIRAKEANKQLKYCPAGGLLLTDLSSLFETPQVRATTRDAINNLEARLYKFMYDHLRIVRSATSASSCFAWVAYVQSPYFLPDGPPMQIFQWKTFN